MTALLLVLAFVTAALYDVAHTVYVRAVDCGRRHTASTWSVVMYGMACAGFYLCVDRGWSFMIPEALGYYAGTWLAMGGCKTRSRFDLPARADMAPCLHGVAQEPTAH